MTDCPYKCLIVLANLMSQDCILGEESVARAELAIELFRQDKFDCLVTSGWAYRQDCPTPIADVMADYITNQSDIDPDHVIPDTNARDTVGDACFLLKRLQDKGMVEITVVTSDYHVARTKIIFEKLFGNSATVEVFGADTKRKSDPETLESEQASIQAFERTFKDADFNNTHSIYQTLATNHPFYNGEIYPKIEF